MRLRYATENDIPLLAELNRQFVEDEGASNPMSIGELADRMTAWLEADYKAVLFEARSTPLAYALYRDSEDGIYLRQFFVAREHRRAGIGTRAVHLFREQVVPPDQSLSLEVLAHNDAGIAFWQTAGFRKHALSFRVEPNQSKK